MLPQTGRERLRLALVLAALGAVAWLIWSARDVLSPFLIGIVAAFVLAPIVDRVVALLPFRRSRPELAATLAVAVVYGAVLLLLALLALFLLPRIGDQFEQLAESTPGLVATTRERIEQSAAWYREQVPRDVQREINHRTEDIARRAGDIGIEIARRTVAFLTGGLANVLAYIVVPFWLFYVLKDRALGTRAFYTLFPPAWQGDVAVMLHRANGVLGSYIRAQLLLSTLSGAVMAVGLTLFDIKFSLILGVIAGIANLIPVLGPMIGGVPILIVTAATHPGWTILWVFLFMFITQNVKDYVLVPRVQGDAVNLHPAIILVLLVIAGHLAGFWGLLVAVPLAAVVRDIFVYIYRRLGDDPPPATVHETTSGPASTAAGRPA
jgi:predicted PurR-regulated permease PerM